MQKATFKETLKTRWLLLLAYFFELVGPFIVVLFVVFQSKETTPHFKLNAGLFIAGLGYLCFASHFVREKIKKLKEGVAKLVFNKLNNIIPLIVVGLLVYLIENCLEGFDVVFYAIIASIVLGSILEVMEYVLNRKFIYEQKVITIAKEQADLETAKERIKEESKEL